MKTKATLSILGALALGTSIQANTVTFSFLENGANVDLGNSSTFTEGSDTITAYANSGQDLYAKSAGGGEIGLGIASDPSGTHEIWGTTFVQLWVPSGESILSLNIENNNPVLDNANIFYSTTLGSLGSLLAGPLGGLYTLPAGYQSGYYIGIQSYLTTGASDTWVGSVVVGPSSTVPDGCSTVGLFGLALAGLGMIRRKFQA